MKNVVKMKQIWRGIRIKKKTVLALILVSLTLSLTTVALIMQNTPTPTWPLAQTINLQHSTAKGLIVVWGNETRANTNITESQASPAVCCRSDGSFVVAWQSNQTGDWDVYVKLFDSAGNNLTDDIRVNGNITNNQASPAVCCRPDGSFVVAWHSTHTGDADVYFKLFNSSGGSITNDMRVNGYVANRQNLASVCCFDNGGFVVAWEGVGQGDDEGVFAKVFNSTGSNVTDDILVNTDTITTQGDPSVCCAGNESFVVTWEHWTMTDDWYDVHAKLFDSSGGSKTGEIIVNGEKLTDQKDSSVCCFSDGSFVVAWYGRGPGDPLGIFTRIFNSTGHYQTGDILVNTYVEVPTFQWEPSVCCFPDDSGFVVTWSSDLQDGSDNGVYARVFNSIGQSLTGESRVNAYTSNDQMYSSVCCFENGSFVVVWQSFGQDTSGYGVYFRIGLLSSPSISPSPLLAMAMVLGQSGTGLSLPLLIGGVLFAVVVVGVLVFWWSRRRT